MIQIMLLYDRYNWDSFSQVRSMEEILKEREDVEFFGADGIDKLDSGAYVWVYGSNLELERDNFIEVKNKGLKVVNFGLSDPNLFSESRLRTCDLFCTNDLNTYRKYKGTNNVYHFQPGVDLARFKKIDAPKDIDVLFIGTLQHGYIPYRKPWLLQLRRDIDRFEGYGNGWDRFLKGEELVLAYNRAVLNIDIATKDSSLSSRIMQAAACGVPTLTLKREDVLECFDDGYEILTYEGGYDDILYMVQDALKYTGWNRLAEMGENVRQRCVAEHGMRKRVDELIKYLQEKTNESS